MNDTFGILLDFGHGPETLGKRSPVWEDGSQLFEYKFNREICDLIIKDLQYYKINYELIADRNKDTSLNERVKRANELNKKYTKSLYLSIHANAGGGTGWEVYTSKGETESDKYASIFFNEMKSEFPDMTFRKDELDGDVDKEENFYVLKYTNMPAVLTENFFMDRFDPDCKLILSEEGKQRIAKAHVMAILKIILLWKNEK